MKNIYYILVLLVVACQKEPIEPVTIYPPQEVHYTVNTRTDASKHINIELWSVEKNTTTKSKLVRTIDTVTTSKQINIILTQDVMPVMYCVTSIRVEILDNKYDTISIDIGNNVGNIEGHASSCQTNFYSIEDTFINLLTGK